MFVNSIFFVSRVKDPPGCLSPTGVGVKESTRLLRTKNLPGFPFAIAFCCQPRQALTRLTQNEPRHPLRLSPIDRIQ